MNMRGVAGSGAGGPRARAGGRRCQVRNGGKFEMAGRKVCEMAGRKVL